MTVTLAPANRAKEISRTKGTGTYTLAGPASSDLQSLAAALAAATGDPTGPWTSTFVATMGAEWEVFEGTVTKGASGAADTLSRDAIQESTNDNLAVDWPAGKKTIICAPSAKVFGDLIQAVTNLVPASLFSGLSKFATKAAMDADLAHSAGEFALVYADPTAALNGFYQKSGASGSGSWAATGLVLDKPYQKSMLDALMTALSAQLGSTTLGRPTTPVTGTAVGNVSYGIAEPLDADSWLDQIRPFGMNGGGPLAIARRLRNPLTNGWTTVASYTVPIKAGAATLKAGVDYDPIPVLKGEYVWVYGYSGNGKLALTTNAADGSGYYFVAGNPSSFTASSLLTGSRLEIGFDFVKQKREIDDSAPLAPLGIAGLVADYDACDQVGLANGQVQSWATVAGDRALNKTGVTAAPGTFPEKLSNGAIRFNGTSDALAYGMGFNARGAATLLSTTALPSLANGRSITCTGRSQGADLLPVVAHHGQSDPADPDWHPAFVQLSPDYRQRLGQANVSSVDGGPYTDQQTIQGMRIHSDGTVWWCNTFGSRIEHSAIDWTTGALTDLGDGYDVPFQPTGLDIRENAGGPDDHFLASFDGTKKVYVYQSGAQVREFAIGLSVNHLHYSAATGLLYITGAATALPGATWVYDPDSGASMALYDGLFSTVTEGGYMEADGTFAICRDSSFHRNALPPVSSIDRYGLNPQLKQIKSTKFMVVGVVSRPALQSSNPCLFACGDPLASGAGGFGMFFPALLDQARFIGRGPGAAGNFIATFPLGCRRRKTLFTMTGEVGVGVSFWVDGTSVSPASTSGSLSNLAPYFFLNTLVLGAARSSVNSQLSLFSNADVWRLAFATDDAGRQVAEGKLAWRHGLVGQLDASHPYKSAPPA